MITLKNFIKKNWGRVGLFFFGLCSLLGVQRGCCVNCPSKPKDITQIFFVENEHIYYTYSNDTLWVRFQYRMATHLDTSFDYAYVYFYGIQSWRTFSWPSLTSPILSDDTIYLPKDSFPTGPMGRKDSLYFTGWAPPDSYDIYIWIEGWKHGGKGERGGGAPLAQQKGEQPTKVFGPGGRQLILYMGNRRVCNLGDTLKDPYAYPLLVQVVDSAGNGINGDTLWFTANRGRFAEFDTNDLITITDTFHYIPNESLLSGISRQPFYIFPNTPANDIIITIRAFKGTNIWATKDVPLYCFADNETSGLNPPKCHETTDKINKNVEIPGDGYNDGTGKKTIKVEIDYASNVIQSGLVELAIDDMKKILATARIDTSSSNIIIDEGIEIPDPLDPILIRQYLVNYRDFRDCVHILIATKRSDKPWIGGETIAFNLLDWGGLTHTKCAHFASTDSFVAQVYLDSTGIIIYSQSIWNSMHTYHPDTLFFHGWDFTKGIAVALAHEIGHALGLLHHHPNGVMQDSVKYNKDYSTYNFFVDSLLNRQPPEDAMNTRDGLGIHTIDGAW